MKTIIIGFSKGSSKWLIGSILIMWFTNKPFSHTYFKFKEDMYDDWTISQSTGHGVGYMCETRFNEFNTTVESFPLQISDDLYSKILKDCHANAGIDYGYLQNLGIFISTCLDKIGIHLKRNPLPIGTNCSEWLYHILVNVYGNWTDKDPALITPNDIRLYLAKGK